MRFKFKILKTNFNNIIIIYIKFLFKLYQDDSDDEFNLDNINVYNTYKFDK
jgi:hypothetical protein